jgi:hypothetical protein
MSRVDIKLLEKLTLSNLLPATLDALLQLSESVERGEYLHTTHSIQHVRIVPRRSTEAAVFVQTREHEVEEFTTWEGIRVSQEVQCCQSPVEAVEAQVFGEPVLELVFALERVSAGIDR